MIRSLPPESQIECPGRTGIRKTIDSAHHRWWQISEVVFGIPFLAAIGLQWVVPLWLPRGVFAIFTSLAGAAVGIFGVTLVALARRELARGNQPTDPGRPTTRMITTGVAPMDPAEARGRAVCLRTSDAKGS
jgi:hypothetical protein